MKLACICFTDQGAALAARVEAAGLAQEFGLTRCYGATHPDLAAWTARAFAEADALLFIGAAGIAVRAIALHLLSKTSDPAVLLMEETGQFVIPLLSGHIGGANRLARALAQALGATAVITTATDRRGLLAVDEWAAQRGLAIRNPARIKAVSGKLLRQGSLKLLSAMPLTGAIPQELQPARDIGEADILISPEALPSAAEALQLVPRCLALGLGCRKGASEQAIAAAVAAALADAGLLAQAVAGVYSIDLKAAEPGLLAFCQRQGWPLTTYSAAQLAAVMGSVSASAFVAETTGVDNVCERAALLAGGKLVLGKTARDGVTVALALRKIPLDFEGWL